MIPIFDSPLIETPINVVTESKQPSVIELKINIHWISDTLNKFWSSIKRVDPNDNIIDINFGWLKLFE